MSDSDAACASGQDVIDVPGIYAADGEEGEIGQGGGEMDEIEA